MRPNDSKLTNMALAALEELAALSRFGPIERSRPLAVLLAYLASRSDGGRIVYDNFWRSLGIEKPYDRSAGIQSSLEGIYRNAGRKRSLTIVSHFERRATEMMGRNPPP